MKDQSAANTAITPIIVAGVFLGLGLGGFVDGILLHQILAKIYSLSLHIEWE
jgi:uncharacterized membrane protein